jgi:hypothetical protein
MSATVDVNGAAELMKIHPKTVLDLINSGAIPAARECHGYQSAAARSEPRRFA